MFVVTMKQVFHKITSFLMAFVVLFSTMSFTISEHYCGEILVDTAIFHKAKSCGMDAANLQTENTSDEDCSIKKKNCCSEKETVIDGQDELKLSLDHFSLDKQLIVASFVYTYLNLFEGLEENVIPFQDYSPPVVVKDILLLDESFLI